MSTPVGEIPPPVANDPLTPSHVLRPPNNTANVSTNNYRATVEAENYNGEKLTTIDSEYSAQIARARSKREENRLGDDLEVLRAERDSVKDERSSFINGKQYGHTQDHQYDHRRSSDLNLGPPTGQAQWTPPTQPANKFAAFVIKVHKSSVLVRYFTYIVPVALIILIPLLLGAFLYKEKTVGDVYMKWFCIWLMIVWLSLWAGRLIADCFPPIVSVIASIFTNNNKKWKNVATNLKLPMTLFFWWMAIFISFQPTMRNHHRDGNTDMRYWERRTNTVLLSVFVGTGFNLVEKMIIQIIALNFHTRTYEDRIVLNKFQISCLAKLYAYSREHLKGYTADRPISSSGARTPRDMLLHAAVGARSMLRSIGDAVGKVAGDFTGKEVSNSASPKVVVRTLLQEREGTLALARRLFRTFADEDSDVVHADDLRKAIPDEEECDGAFQMFDRDLNGDISCEEMELACNEVAQERKAITAGLQDLDVVIGQLDGIFTFIVIILTVLLFVSLISASSMNVLTSASALVLAFSFAFASTAQEIVNAILFVFVKHPFDVGDRVDIFNSGDLFNGATYYVKNFSLLYTEFKKPEGHIVQMPNALLNNLVILNMRRTGAGLAEAIPVYLKFGTTLEQIDELRERMLAFVRSEKREYMGKILTELKEIRSPTWELRLNVVFFYKSNWQNELVRLARRNKIICSLMTALDELGIESTHMRWPGHKPSAPLYLQGGLPGAPAASTEPFNPENPQPVDGVGLDQNTTAGSSGVLRRNPSIPSSTLSRSRSTKAVDLSLGAKDMVAYDDSSDVFADRRRPRAASHVLARVKEEEEAQRKLSRSSSKASSGRNHHNLSLTKETTKESKGSGGGGNIRNMLFGRSHTHNKEDDIEGSAYTETEPFRPGNSAESHELRGVERH